MIIARFSREILFVTVPMAEKALSSGRDVVLEKPAAMNLCGFEHLADIIKASRNRV